MKSLERHTAETSIDVVAAALERDGVVLVEGLMDATSVDRVNEELQEALAAADPAMKHLNETIGAFFGKSVRHVSGLAGKSKTFAEQVMCHPIYMALCDRILLPHCASYQLNLGHLMDRGPGAQKQAIHRDHDVWVHFPHPRAETLLSSVVALVDFTEENGATVVVPGSHLWPRDRVPTDDEFAVAEMPAGSAVIYLGATLHAGGTNSTQDQWRRGFHLSYTLGWLRTEENNVLAVPAKVARELSPLAQNLLGYGVHDASKDYGGYLGMVDMRDPGEMLREGSL